MSDKKYQFWTALCLATAISSSLLFDKYGELRAAFGTIGILSAIAAAILYFRQEIAHRPDDVKDTQAVASKKIEIVKTQEPLSAPLGAHVNQLSLWANQSVGLTTGSRRRSYTFYVSTSEKRDAYYYRLVARDRMAVEESHKRDLRQYFVEEVVEIVQRLSKSCEFEWKPTGELKILPRLTGLSEPTPPADVNLPAPRKGTIH